MAKTIIELYPSDLCEILSKKFNAEPDDVKIITSKHWEGYGLDEHEVIDVKVTITKNSAEW